MTLKKHFKKTLPAPTLWLEVYFLGTITNICSMFHAGHFPLSSDLSFFCVKQSSTRNNYNIKLTCDNHCHTTPLRACAYPSFPNDTI